MTRECEKTMSEVKEWDKDKIKRDWIDKGRPCYFINGLRFRGATAHPISQEEAASLIKKHSFGMGFYSLSWGVEDGKVALVFEEYSEYDME